MDLEARVALAKEVGEEIVTEEELRALFAAKAHPIAYDGFEPSGTAHIAQGVMRAINVNKMTRAGCRFKMFVADWHAWANNKMGGDLERIQVTGKYLIEIWRATGMDLSKVDFVWASEFIEDEAYWKKVMNVARDTSLDRVLRTTQIMGRSEKDKLSASQILYPCMQAADIFHLQADITQLGMDQRKVNMLAREVGPKLGFWKPVVVSHHMLMGLQAPPASGPKNWSEGQREIIQDTVSLLEDHLATWKGRDIQADEEPIGLKVEKTAQDALFSLIASISDSDSLNVVKEKVKTVGGKVKSGEPSGQDMLAHLQGILDQALAEIEQSREVLVRELEERATAMKMSKSNPDSAIFMTDTPEQVAAKLKKAFCPEKQVQDNPVLEYFRYIVFERFPSVKVERPPKFGGDREFASYHELAAAFEKGELHPMDAKTTCARYISQLLQPVREHFEKNEAARELKRHVESFQVTR